MSDRRTPQPIHYGRCPRCRGFYSSEGHRRISALNGRLEISAVRHWSCDGCGAIVDVDENIRHIQPEAVEDGFIFDIYPSIKGGLRAEMLKKVILFTTHLLFVSIAIALFLIFGPRDLFMLNVVIYASVMVPSVLSILFRDRMNKLFMERFFGQRELPGLMLTEEGLKWGEEEVSLATIEAIEEDGRFLLIRTSDGEAHRLEPIGGPHVPLLAINAARGLGEGIGTSADVPELLLRRGALTTR